MNNGNDNRFNINQLELLISQVPENVRILKTFEGVFTKEKIHELTGYISQITKGDVQAYKKFFYVFIELAQNVSNYSDWRKEDGKNSVGIGSIVIGEANDSYFMAIGNIINNKDLQVLIKKCDIINSLDRESLRLFKRQQRNLIPGTNQNAHIGLIMVALTTRRKLDITIKTVDDQYSFFILKAFIPKSKNISHSPT